MNTPLARLQHDLDLLDSLFTRWDARESVGTEIAHAIGVGSEYRFVRELMAAYRGMVGKADALEAVVRGYRAATHFVGADSWDGCSDCMEILRLAAEADAGRDMTADEIAVALRSLRGEAAISAVPPSQGTETPMDEFRRRLKRHTGEWKRL